MYPVVQANSHSGNIRHTHTYVHTQTHIHTHKHTHTLSDTFNRAHLGRSTHRNGADRQTYKHNARHSE